MLNLRATFYRSFARFPGAKLNGKKHLQIIYITSRSSLRSVTYTSVLHDIKRVDDTARATDVPGAEKGLSRDTEKAGSFDWQILRRRFRLLSNCGFVAVRRRADGFTSKAASTFSLVGSHLNKLTGYEDIEVLKRRVVEQGMSSP
jgi:sensitive to high expression protein 9